MKKSVRGRDVAELREELLQQDPQLAERWRESEPRRRLSTALVAMRKAARLTQQRLAREAGWKQPQVARMESATGPWPSPEALRTYAHACGRSVGLVFVHPATERSVHIDGAVAFGSSDPDQLLDRMVDANVRVSKA